MQLHALRLREHTFTAKLAYFPGRLGTIPLYKVQEAAYLKGLNQPRGLRI